MGNAFTVMRKVCAGFRLEKPPHCKRCLYNVMLRCWAESPDDRPDFASLVEDFQLMIDFDHIDLSLFPEDVYHNLVGLDDEKV